MDIPKIILTVLQVITALFLIAVVLLQTGKRAGINGAIGGGSSSMDSLNKRGKARGWDAKMARATKYVAIIFMVLTLVLNFV